MAHMREGCCESVILSGALYSSSFCRSRYSWRGGKYRTNHHPQTGKKTFWLDMLESAGANYCQWSGTPPRVWEKSFRKRHAFGTNRGGPTPKKEPTAGAAVPKAPGAECPLQGLTTILAVPTCLALTAIPEAESLGCEICSPAKSSTFSGFHGNRIVGRRLKSNIQAKCTKGQRFFQRGLRLR